MHFSSVFRGRRFLGQPKPETVRCLDAVAAGWAGMGKWRCRLDRRIRGAPAANPILEFHDVCLPADASGSAKSLSVTRSLRKVPGDIFNIGSASTDYERRALINDQKKLRKLSIREKGVRQKPNAIFYAY